QATERVRSVPSRAPGAPLFRVGDEAGLSSQLYFVFKPPSCNELGHMVVASVLPSVVRRIDVQEVDRAECLRHVCGICLMGNAAGMSPDRRLGNDRERAEGV